MTKKVHSRRQTKAVVLRMHPDERLYFELAAAMRTMQVAQENPGTVVKLTPFLRAAGRRWAKKLLGISLAEFRAAMTQTEEPDPKKKRTTREHDFTVSVAQGTFTYDDIAPHEARLPRWEVRENGKVLGTVDVHEFGHYAKPKDPVLAIAMGVFERKYPDDFGRRESETLRLGRELVTKGGRALSQGKDVSEAARSKKK